jgi:hypothetical protein
MQRHFSDDKGIVAWCVISKQILLRPKLFVLDTRRHFSDELMAEQMNRTNGTCHVSGNFLPFKQKSHIQSPAKHCGFSPLQKDSHLHDTGHCNVYNMFHHIEGCPAYSLVGNGYCDDATNNEACQFDGGDCCLNYIVVIYCTICLCDETGIQRTLAPGGT